MSKDTEYLGFTIRLADDKSYLVIRDKFIQNFATEEQAKRWIIIQHQFLTRNAELKQISEKTILFSPPGEIEETNLVAIVNESAQFEEKYIKIISRKNAPPELDIKNLDANEVMGLIRRADHIITNIVLRNGSF